MSDLYLCGGAEPAPVDDAATKRLQVLRQLCERIASDIMTARVVLHEHADDGNVGHLVANALDRIGWMADQASVVAGASLPSAGGDADGWLLNGLLRESALPPP